MSHPSHPSHDDREPPQPQPGEADSILAPAGSKNSGRPLLDRHAWLIYVLPLVVFMVFTSLEPKPPAREEGAQADTGWQLPYDAYPLVYALKIAATLAAVAYVWPGYRAFPWRVTRWSLIAGVVGAGVWIGLSKLEIERRLLGPLGLDSLLGLGQRSAFNPLVELRANPLWAYGFLAIRLFGLAVLVLIIEEFFLRGFLMRFVVRADWWNVPFGQVNTAAVIAGTLVPMLMHPGELFAAAVWFSLITWLMVHTRSIWDCIVAHAITNSLLGCYVLASGDWHLM